MEPGEQPEAIMTENHSGTVKRALTHTLLFVLAILAAYTGYWYLTQTQPDEQVVATGQAEQFERKLSTFANKLGVDNQQALVDAQALVADATSPYEEGRAKLALGLVQLRLDVRAAIATFKEISVDERFHPFTRERAVWYTVATFLYSHNDELAREHIYTGPIWGSFLQTDQNTLQTANQNALQYANDLYQTPQVTSQLAVFAARDILESDVEGAQRDELAASVFVQINRASDLLDKIYTEDAALYAGTGYVVTASTLDNLAVALDVLQQADAGVTATQVDTAYQDALAAATANELTTTHEYHTRYHYADWLLRQDAVANETKIAEVLAPMQTLNANSVFAQSFTYTLANNQSEPDNNQPGQAKNILRLVEISPAFDNLLQTLGTNKEPLTSTN